MKSTCKLTHKLIALSLLFGLFLQSCGNSFNQFVPQVKLTNRTSELPDDSIIDTNNIFVTSGGYLASFYENEGALKADLRADEKQLKPNYKGVPVVVEQGTYLSMLTKLDSTTQQNRIQLKRSQSGNPNCLFILKGGVLGGSSDKEKGVPQTKPSTKKEGSRLVGSKKEGKSVKLAPTSKPKGNRSNTSNTQKLARKFFFRASSKR